MKVGSVDVSESLSNTKQNKLKVKQQTRKKLLLQERSRYYLGSALTLSLPRAESHKSVTVASEMS